jgi:hypothetical protein
MKRAWALIVAAFVLLGCRSAQPTNPFIRTTVPPPATGQGAVVVPGEQYYPSGAPPVVNPGVPTLAPGGPMGSPGMGPPTVPVAPPPAFAPPPAAPPPVIGPKDKFGPPGGSFQYNQS